MDFNGNICCQNVWEEVVCLYGSVSLQRRDLIIVDVDVYITGYILHLSETL